MAESQHAEASKQAAPERVERTRELEGEEPAILVQRAVAPTFQGGRIDPRRLTPQAILALQRTAGNRAVNALLGRNAASRVAAPAPALVQRSLSCSPFVALHAVPNMAVGGCVVQRTPSTIRSGNESRITVNPHVDLEIPGRQAQANWFPNNPANTTADFSLTPGSSGTVMLHLDYFWHFATRMRPDEDASWALTVAVPFRVNVQGQIHIGVPLPWEFGGGTGAVVEAGDTAIQGSDTTMVEIVLSPRVMRATTAGASITTGGGAGVGPVQASDSYTGGETSAGGISMRIPYRVILQCAPTAPPVEMPPQGPNFAAFGEVHFQPNHPDFDDTGDQAVHNFCSNLPVDVRTNLAHARIELDGYASTSGGAAHNTELSTVRALAVKRRILAFTGHAGEDSQGSDGPFHITPHGAYDATVRGESYQERRVEIYLSAVHEDNGPADRQ